MKIFNFFQHINLTSDQQKSLKSIFNFLESEDRVFILQGYAGSGKTTLLKGVVEYLESIEKNYQLMAPTGRAAKVINQKTGFESTTVHKGVYSFDELQEIKQSEEKNDVSFLYQYKLRNNLDVHDSILIVDEASMVSDILSEGEFFRFGSGHLLRDLITYSRIQDSSTKSKIIFIGDPAQLPPIGMNFSPALDSEYLKEEYNIFSSNSEMKQVKRQDAGNGILASAKKIRQCLTSSYFNDFDLRGNQVDIFNPMYENYLDTYNAQKGQKIIICYKNKTALDLNNAIRRDKFGKDLPIQKSDTIIIGSNNYRLGVMNGEFGVVSDSNPTVVSRDVRFKTKGGSTESVRLTWRSVDLILPDENGQPKNISSYILENYLYGDNYLKPEEQRALYVDFIIRNPKIRKGTEEFKEAISNDPFFNCIQLKYGYAVTCHKAQGGEWANAFVFWDRSVQSDFNFFESEHITSGKTNSDFYRWAYTAITRASEKLFCINPPYFSSFSKMSFINQQVQDSLNVLEGRSSKPVEIEIKDELYEELKRFNLLEAPLTIQDHFISHRHYLKEQYIDVVEWERVGYEIRYVFKWEDKTAAVKYWVNKKNEFKTTFHKISGKTNSDELFEDISKILEKPSPIIVKRNTAEGILTKIEFEVELEESKPFLKILFEAITNRLNFDEVISEVTHFEYRERYTIKKGSSSCVVDFEYDKKGFFGRVLPIKNQCNSSNLVNRIQEIVNNLKTSEHAI